MATLQDHDRRDAEHAARSIISIHIGRYVRRLIEDSKATIAERGKGDTDGEIDWTVVGVEAAEESLRSYGILAPTPALVQGDKEPEALNP